ncbi:MAG TPA: hypothetical protein VFX24_09755 [Ktedonobacterales bacterium]|nr:hypothetical protein [Ktedonobacterales bacterium]
MTDEKKQRGGWFRRKGRETDSTSTSPQVSETAQAAQTGNGGKLSQTMSAWVRALQERRDTANRTRALATRLNQDLAGILATCTEQQKALNQRSMRTQVQLSMALGRLTGIVHQLDTTHAFCAYLIEATQPQLPAVMVAAGANGANGAPTLAAPVSPSRPLLLNGNPSGPLAAPVVRDLGRGGFKRMARDLQRAFRETEQATQEILRPIQMQALRMPEVNALANALAALEPLMTWLNQRCEALTATYCAPAGSQQPGNPPGRRSDFWQ